VRDSDQLIKLGDLMFAKAVSSSFRAARLGDLLVAKVLSGAVSTQVTQAGEMTGDIFYLSPERTDPTGEIDVRSDIYSLGATVYALLTGRPPCEGDTLSEVIQKIRYAKPEDPKKYQLAIPEALADVVLRMLEKRRSDRYQKPEELLADLERIGKYQRVKL
jgi:serine/threonine protein kinase